MSGVSFVNLFNETSLEIDELIVNNSLDVEGELVNFPVDNSTITINNFVLEVPDGGITDPKIVNVSASKIIGDFPPITTEDIYVRTIHPLSGETEINLEQEVKINDTLYVDILHKNQNLDAILLYSNLISSHNITVNDNKDLTVTGNIIGDIKTNSISSDTLTYITVNNNLDAIEDVSIQGTLSVDDITGYTSDNVNINKATITNELIVRTIEGVLDTNYGPTTKITEFINELVTYKIRKPLAAPDILLSDDVVCDKDIYLGNIYKRTGVELTVKNDMYCQAALHVSKLYDGVDSFIQFNDILRITNNTLSCIQPSTPLILTSSLSQVRIVDASITFQKTGVDTYLYMTNGEIQSDRCYLSDTLRTNQIETFDTGTIQTTHPILVTGYLNTPAIETDLIEPYNNILSKLDITHGEVTVGTFPAQLLLTANSITTTSGFILNVNSLNVNVDGVLTNKNFVDVWRNTTQVVNNAVETSVSWNTEITDTGNYFNSGTFPTRFTYPASKKNSCRWFVTYHVHTTNIVVNRTGLWVSKNGSTSTRIGFSENRYEIANVRINGSCIVTMDPGDYIELYIYCDNAGFTTTIGGVNLTASNRVQILEI